MLVACKQCGVEFNKAPSQIKKGKNNFCSRSCAAKYNNRKHPKRTKEGSCVACGEAIHSRYTYCSNCWKEKKEAATKAKKEKVAGGEVPYKPGKTREEYNAYMREYMAKRYQLRRRQAIEFLGGKCAWCGSIEELEVDHIDRTNKSFEIADMYGLSEEKYMAEVKKCQLLCNKHHKEKSVIERGGIPAKGHHGRPSSYKYCKCEVCLEARRKYQRQWAAKRKAEASDHVAQLD